MYYHVEHWHWWVLSLIFVVTTAVAQSPMQLILTFATAVLGLLVWFQPDVPAKTQLLIFGLIVGIGMVIIQFLGKNKQPDESGPLRDPNFVDLDESPSDDVVGRTFTLDRPIVDGLGSIHFDNQTWKLRGDDAEKGSTIRIESVDGIDSMFLQISIVK